MGGRSLSLPQLTKQSPTKSLSLTRLEWPRLVPEAVRSEFQRYGMPRAGHRSNKHICAVGRYFKFQSYIDGAENRGITLEQLQEVYAYAEEHYREWKTVEKSSINTYHLNAWIVKPATYEPNSAMVEHLADRKQPPLWYVCNWWGQPFVELLLSMRQHVAVRDLMGLVPYWLSAFALRPHAVALEDQQGASSLQGHFIKAMHVARYHTLLVFDGGVDGAAPACLYRRLWCLFECSTCAQQAPMALVDAVICSGERLSLLTSGPTLTERTTDRYLPGKGVNTKIKRERSFPMEIIERSLGVHFLHAQASVDRDRCKILNALDAGESVSEPPEDCEGYDEATRRLRSFFALVFWHRALIAPRPVEEKAGKKHMLLLRSLALAVKCDANRKAASMCVSGVDLREEESLDLIVLSFPPKLTKLRLEAASTYLDDALLEKFAQALPETLQVLALELADCKDVTDKGLRNFVTHLPKEVRWLQLGVARTQVSAGVLAVCQQPLQINLSAKPARRADVFDIEPETNQKDQTREEIRRLARENVLALPKSRMTKEVRSQMEKELTVIRRQSTRRERKD
eukprot:TRINITY_DN16185_c0_g1_i1.p1 TRINITY_DN16185_c0_g1~~TRINITY_DN16185_c0_g1_i1.p1  ORF type:complete len:629 (+),score=142.21 TRINITY_DN16185_c0_g1_i1:180-1889(+)